MPQLHGQYEGDRSRKDVLVEHGFRLPSAVDNRPLRFDELYERINQCIFMSATPASYEISQSAHVVDELHVLVSPGREEIRHPTERLLDRIELRAWRQIVGPIEQGIAVGISGVDRNVQRLALTAVDDGRDRVERRFEVRAGDGDREVLRPVPAARVVHAERDMGLIGAGDDRQPGL